MNEIGIIVLLSPQLSVSSSQMDVFIMNRHIPLINISSIRLSSLSYRDRIFPDKSRISFPENNKVKLDISDNFTLHITLSLQ